MPTPGIPSPADRKSDVADQEVAEYDQELARQMGEDARRVADGELSQAAFYERYHDAVLAEFGVDERDPGKERRADE
jgi:molybdopterin-containing oxidoreductase family iron-sulfur binding subunit